jgi:hypothetical protein
MIERKNDKENYVTMTVNDLGVSAFCKMRGYEVLCKRGRSFDFKVLESEQDDFIQLQIEFTNSVFQEYDNCLMSLKKMPDSK